MAAARRAVSDTYDARVGLEPVTPGDIPSFAYALVKKTYAITPNGLMPAEAEPLLFDLYTDELAFPPVPPGSDYWVDKAATDVVIKGSAFPACGKPAATMQVVARVGPIHKRVAVFGRREIRWRSRGPVEIAPAEPFSEMPLVYENCYGGLDPRVPVPEEDREEFERYAAAGVAADHPGLYPRNPIGKGYCVLPEPLLGLEMPNLEDPDDLLSADRLISRAPELWYRQPLPWCFETTNALHYPRLLFLGLDAWFPSSDPSAMPEFQRGYVPLAAAAPAEHRMVDLRESRQEAALGMVARLPLGGLPVMISGMQPEEDKTAFVVPDHPGIALFIDGEKFTPRPQLTQLVIRPADKRAYAVWCARTSGLPRKFLPGVHKNIPLAASVDGGPLLPYESPPTIRERLAADPPLPTTAVASSLGSDKDRRS